MEVTQIYANSLQRLVEQSFRVIKHCLLITVTEIEVYEYPDDCLATELISHFLEPPYNAHCLTDDEKGWNNSTNTFILEFTVIGNYTNLVCTILLHWLLFILGNSYFVNQHF